MDIVFYLLFVIVLLHVLSLIIKHFFFDDPVHWNHPILFSVAKILGKATPYIQRYLFNQLPDRPFTLKQMQYIQQAACGNGTLAIAFGSQSSNREFIIKHALIPRPTLHEQMHSYPLLIGKRCKLPFIAGRRIYISGMGTGALSQNAIAALSHGARKSQILMNTGESGLSQSHSSGGAELIFQIGVGGFLCKDIHGRYSRRLFELLGKNNNIKMFEIKLSQGAHPGLEGGTVAAKNASPENSISRGVMPFNKLHVEGCHADIDTLPDLFSLIHLIKTSTDKPVGIKLCLSSKDQLDELVAELNRYKNTDYNPDFITIDGAEGGSALAPYYMLENAGLPISQSLPMLHKALVSNELREQICIFASGKLSSPEAAAWAFSAGADMIGVARGFMMAMGCIQAMKCISDRCPSGISSTNSKHSKAIRPELKSESVARYAKGLEKDLLNIAAACGVDCYTKLTSKHIERNSVLTKKTPDTHFIDIDSTTQYYKKNT